MEKSIETTEKLRIHFLEQVIKAYEDYDNTPSESTSKLELLHNRINTYKAKEQALKQLLFILRH